jgi:hypothetical protein
MMPPKFARVARTLRKHDTWAENFFGVGFVTVASQHTNSVVNIRIRLMCSIFSVSKQCSVLNSTDHNTENQINDCLTRNEMHGLRLEA